MRLSVALDATRAAGSAAGLRASQDAAVVVMATATAPAAGNDSASRQSEPDLEGVLGTG